MGKAVQTKAVETQGGAAAADALAITVIVPTTASRAHGHSLIRAIESIQLLSPSARWMACASVQRLEASLMP